MNNNSFDKILVRNFKVNYLFNHKIPKEIAFYDLKTKYNFSNLCTIVDSIPSQFNHFIYGNPLPKNYGELGISPYINFSNNFENELNWLFLSIRKYTFEINSFLNYKSQFENYLLKGNIKTAEAILQKIEIEFGFSIWSIESRFLIYELLGGLEENKSYLKSLQVENLKGYILFMSHYFSFKAEKELSVNRYNDQIKTIAKKLIDSGTDIDTTNDIEYYFFKLNFFNYPRFNKFSFIQSIEFRSSIIDRYLTFIRIAQTILSFEETDNYSFLKNRFYYLSKKINDPLIKNIQVFFNPNERVIINETDRIAISILDTYTKGKYDEALVQSREFILASPTAFEFYIVYIKCLLNLKLDFIAINNNDSFQDNILKEAYILLKKDIDPRIPALNLSKIALNLSNFNFSLQMMGYVLSESESTNKFLKYSLFNSTIINPLFHQIFQNKEISIQFINNIKENISNSITLDFITHYQIQKLKKTISELDIPIIRKKIYQATAFQQEGSLLEAINIWESLFEETQPFSHLFQIVIYNLYNCYYKNKQYNKCIDLYVDTFYINPNFLFKIDYSQLQLLIKESRFRIVIPSVNVPIFYSITNSDDNQLHLAYERFIISNNVEKPSQLIELSDNFDKKKFIYFLYNVCTTDIFKHSVFINGTRAKLNERISICKFLMDFDKENEAIYKEELAHINNQLIVQEGMQEYDESKIFINEKMIINSELRELEKDFIRYLNSTKLVEEKGIDLLVLGRGGNVQSVSLTNSKSKSEDPIFSKNPLFDIFKDMFLKVREAFLTSQFGLVAYLSTRIRHGVFESEIRPQFEKFNLITEKNIETDKYKINHYWNSKLVHLSDSSRDKIQVILSNFSRSTDNLINDVVKKYLQINLDNDKPYAWFNFTFDDKELLVGYFLLKQDNSYKTFLNISFELLWEKTEKSLENIKNNFEKTIKTDFEKILIKLESDLHTVISKYQLPDLFNNITTSRVNVQNDLDRIARWFTRSNSKFSDFNIYKIINISLEFSNKGFGTKTISLEKTIDCDIIFKGEYFPYFVDLFRIFFDNILKHSGSKSDILKTQIKIKILRDFLSISIINSISELDNLESTKAKIIEERAVFALDERKYLTEGKSGLHKAIRILQSDLKNKSNQIDFYILEDNTFNVDLLIKIDNIKI